MMIRWTWQATFIFFAMGVPASDMLFLHEVPEDSLPARIPLDQIPLGLPERSIPSDNPLTDTRVRLGRRLFFDPILSADRTIACASCHRPDHGFASAGRPLGIRGRQLSRRAPTLRNRAFGKSFFWDGRADSLEHQALLPIADADEMGSSVAESLRRLQADKGYKAMFDASFPDGVTAVNLGKALASFERVLLRGASNVDSFRAKGEHGALSAQERHGLWLYESKARCWRCHSGANFTDESYHNTGVSWGNQPLDLGRFAVTKKDEDRGKFKTPTLRGVALTGPYMHDGTLSTLEDVVGFYNRGGRANPNLDNLVSPLTLTDEEMRDLVAFLKGL
jgi:cytochrome c peroxidase